MKLLSRKSTILLITSIGVILATAGSGLLFESGNQAVSMTNSETQPPSTPTVATTDSNPTATPTRTTTAPIPTLPFSPTNAPEMLDGSTDWDAMETAHQQLVRATGGAAFTHREEKRSPNGSVLASHSVTHSTNNKTDRMYRKSTHSTRPIERYEQYNDPQTRHAYMLFHAGDKRYLDIVHDRVDDGNAHNLTIPTQKAAWSGIIVFSAAKRVTWTYSGHEMTEHGTTVAHYAATPESPDSTVVSGHLRISERGVVRAMSLTRRIDQQTHWNTRFELETGPQAVPTPEWITKESGRAVVDLE